MERIPQALSTQLERYRFRAAVRGGLSAVIVAACSCALAWGVLSVLDSLGVLLPARILLGSWWAISFALALTLVLWPTRSLVAAASSLQRFLGKEWDIPGIFELLGRAEHERLGPQVSRELLLAEARRAGAMLGEIDYRKVVPLIPPEWTWWMIVGASLYLAVVAWTVPEGFERIAESVSFGDGSAREVECVAQMVSQLGARVPLPEQPDVAKRYIDVGPANHLEVWSGAAVQFNGSLIVPVRELHVVVLQDSGSRHEKAASVAGDSFSFILEPPSGGVRWYLEGRGEDGRLVVETARRTVEVRKAVDASVQLVLPGKRAVPAEGSRKVGFKGMADTPYVDLFQVVWPLLSPHAGPEETFVGRHNAPARGFQGSMRVDGAALAGIGGAALIQVRIRAFGRKLAESKPILVYLDRPFQRDAAILGCWSWYRDMLLRCAGPGGDRSRSLSLPEDCRPGHQMKTGLSRPLSKLGQQTAVSCDSERRIRTDAVLEMDSVLREVRVLLATKAVAWLRSVATKDTPLVQMAVGADLVKALLGLVSDEISDVAHLAVMAEVRRFGMATLGGRAQVSGELLGSYREMVAEFERRYLTGRGTDTRQIALLAGAFKELNELMRQQQVLLERTVDASARLQSASREAALKHTRELERIAVAIRGLVREIESLRESRQEGDFAAYARRWVDVMYSAADLLAKGEIGVAKDLLEDAKSAMRNMAGELDISATFSKVPWVVQAALRKERRVAAVLEAVEKHETTLTRLHARTSALVRRTLRPTTSPLAEAQRRLSRRTRAMGMLVGRARSLGLTEAAGALNSAARYMRDAALALTGVQPNRAEGTQRRALEELARLKRMMTGGRASRGPGHAEKGEEESSAETSLLDHWEEDLARRDSLPDLQEYAKGPIPEGYEEVVKSYYKRISHLAGTE